ncbi:thioredoxin family protein [Sinisalibacter aestuarii]|uniref:Thioredoxin family protein n=1 Tax=Sinisalibacter aestuarii TaxID=2949426 RepID=A0ABQ5LPP3_9RHOB|nr:thioredoxin family protein [Sinisalibacter aestuarii]GKY86246.1 thioredoxin family protein [Sinisalibacter aestuarii]
MGTNPPVCDFGAPIHDFSLPGTDGKTWTLADVKGEKGTLVMFICNHCPYVMAVIDRIVRDAKELQALGVGVVAISSNDVVTYPQDGPEHMVTLAEEHGFTFPYLYDESQDVARAYEAACTPDFFGYNAAGELQYRGRLDESRREAAPADVRRDLFEAMKLVAATGKGPQEQVASIGCSIKWKD